MVDINRALRIASNTGKVSLGTRSTEAAIEGGSAKLVVLSRNLPADTRKTLNDLAAGKSVPVVEYAGANTELGPACGKPFAVAALAVLDAGESDIMQLTPR